MATLVYRFVTFILHPKTNDKTECKGVFHVVLASTISLSILYKGDSKSLLEIILLQQFNSDKRTASKRSSVKEQYMNFLSEGTTHDFFPLAHSNSQVFILNRQKSTEVSHRRISCACWAAHRVEGEAGRGSLWAGVRACAGAA